MSFGVLPAANCATSSSNVREFTPGEKPRASRSTLKRLASKVTHLSRVPSTSSVAIVRKHLLQFEQLKDDLDRGQTRSVRRTVEHPAIRSSFSVRLKQGSS